MQLSISTLILLSVLVSAPALSTNGPTDSDAGIASITWTGFDQKTATLNASAGVGSFVLNLPSVLTPSSPYDGSMNYQEQIKVLPAYGPKPAIGPIDPNGPWFVERRALSVANGKETVLSTMTLSINKSLVAVSPKGDTWSVPKGATHLDYRLGRLVTVVGPGQQTPGGLPKNNVKKVPQYKPTTVRVPVVSSLCQVDMNRYRPIPCEFETVKLEILGKSGQVLFTVLPNDNTPITVSKDEAKKTQADNLFVYGAKWTVRRIHNPTLAPNKGYMVGWGNTTTDFAKEVDEHGFIATSLDLSGPVGKQFTIPFDIEKRVISGSTMHQLLLENDVTKTKFSLGVTGSVRAETNLKLNW